MINSRRVIAAEIVAGKLTFHPNLLIILLNELPNRPMSPEFCLQMYDIYVFKVNTPIMHKR